MEGLAQPQPGTHVGGLLRSCRLRARRDLADVAVAVHVRRAQLEAIESGQYERLPGSVYAQGFIRAYAEYLGLDGDEMARRFREEIAGRKSDQPLHFPRPLAEGETPKGGMLLLGAMIAVLAYGSWYVMTSRGVDMAELIAPLPERLERLVGGIAPAVMPAGPSSPSPAEPAGAPSATPAPVPANVPAPVATRPGAAGTVAAGPGRAGEKLAAASPTSAASAGAVAGPPAPGSAPAAGGAPAPGVPVQPATPPATPAPASLAPASLAPAQATPAQATPAQATPAQATPAQVTARAAQAPAIPAPDTAAAAAAAGEPAAADLTASAGGGQALAAEPPDGGDVLGAPTGRIVLRAKAESWVEVRDADSRATLMARLLRPGESYRVPDRPGLTLVTGNAGGIIVLVDGETMPPLGRDGAVRRGIQLDPQSLRRGVETAVTQ